MAERDAFNHKLETLHKTVKVKTKPSKKLPGASKAKPKSKPKAKPTVSPAQGSPSAVAAPPKMESSPPPMLPPENEEHSPAPAQDQPVETALGSSMPAAAKEEKMQATATVSRVVDKTLHRHHKVKNTFTAVFPAYGLTRSDDGFATSTRLMSKNLHEAEATDWTYHMRLDGMKRYTEEMLKAANMRGGKK